MRTSFTDDGREVVLEPWEHVLEGDREVFLWVDQHGALYRRSTAGYWRHVGSAWIAGVRL